MTTMSTRRPSTTPMMEPVITPAWIGTVVGGEEKRKRGALDGRTEENDADNLTYKGGRKRYEERDPRRELSERRKNAVIGERKWMGEESEG